MDIHQPHHALFLDQGKTCHRGRDHIVREYGVLSGDGGAHNGPARRLERLVDTLVGDEWYRMTEIAADFSVISISFRNGEIDERIRRLYAFYKTFLAGEFRALGEAGVIGRRDPQRTAEIVMSLLEGYRHFKHFYVGDEDAESYRNDMKRALSSFWERLAIRDHRSQITDSRFKICFEPGWEACPVYGGNHERNARAFILARNDQYA